MPLAIGTRVGPFELTGSLGAGGMGEVYRARDTRLARDVALKVLPDHLVDGDRLTRLAREAQVVASLSHPNIAAIHGLEQFDGRPVLVLELVEGPTLADRLAQGPIPRDEAVAIARQIAEGLEAAHEQGVVHRDLKPANVKLRPDGLVKVLDFGLAKLTESTAAGMSDATLSPTITSPAMTGVGIILGTAAYMAPEQAAGKIADKRADIWAFGVVLWEMLTGERLFASSESTSHVLADVLRAPLDFDKVPAGPLRDLLRRCLDRDVKMRLRDIGEARVVLSRPLLSTVVPETIGTRSRVPIAWAALAALLAVSTVVALWAPWRTEPDRPLFRLDVDLGDIALPADTLEGRVVLSPDGTRLLYVASVAGGPTRLYIRRLDDKDGEAFALPGTDGAAVAAFSPDSKSVAFVIGGRGGRVFRTSVDGGAPIWLADTGRVSLRSHMTWGDGDVILVSGLGSGLLRITPSSGRTQTLTELTGSEIIHSSPHVLPGGKTVLYTAGDGTSDGNRIYAIPVGGGTSKVVLANGVSPHYVPTGHLLYLLRDTLFAVRFDPDTLQTRGDAVPVVTGVRTTAAGAVPIGSFSVGGNGTLVYRRATDSAVSIGGSSRVDLIDPRGVRMPLIAAAGNYRNIRFSPDGSQLALAASQAPTQGGRGGLNVFVYNRERDSLTQVSFDGGLEPVWSRPDGRYLIFQHSEGIFWTRPGGQSQSLLPRPATNAWSLSDGRMAYNTRGTAAQSTGSPGGSARIFTVLLREEGDALKAEAPEPFSPPQFGEYEAEFSPDGRWIAFSTDKNSRLEVWVRAFPPPVSGQAYPVSNNGGREPRWSRTSNELLYIEGDRLMAVRYTVKGDVFEAGRPSVRVEKFGTGEWDLDLDGRIAVVTPIGNDSATAAPSTTPTEHTVVFLQNFVDEVRRRVK